MSKEPMFPILGDPIIKALPWAMLAPHEAQANSNHGQTLARLAERGGLGIEEALDVLSGQRWGTTSIHREPQIRRALMVMAERFEAARAAETAG